MTAHKGARGRLLVANAAASISGQALLLLVIFLSTPYIVGHLGNSLYGTLVLLVACVEGLGLLSLGANTALVKYLAELLPQGRYDDIQRYFGAAFGLFLFAGFLIGGAVALLAPSIVARFLHGALDAQAGLVKALWLAGAAFLFRFVSQVFIAVPIAVERFDVSTAIQLIQELCRILGAVAVLALGYSLLGVLMVLSAANFVGLAASIAAAPRLRAATPMLIESEAVTLRGGFEESPTSTAKVYSPAMAGTPEITPADESPSPGASCPAPTSQPYGATPPVASSRAV